jgi:hypothetical protein
MRKLLGGVLLAAGILIAGTGGLCSLAVLVTIITMARSPSDLLTGLSQIAWWGVIPMIIGTALFRSGRKMVRDPDRRNTDIHP